MEQATALTTIGGAVGARHRLVGVLGGMGPQATLDFVQKMLAHTPSRRDQDHVPVIVSSIPQIPDRTAAYRHEGDSPVDALVDCGRRLIVAGAELIVMPCNTAHIWFDEIQAELPAPMLHIVDCALEEVRRLRRDQTLGVGLLATEATVNSGLYQTRAGRAQSADGLRWIMPTQCEIVDLIMPGIAAIKAGEPAAALEPLRLAAAALQARGAEAIVLGCTEIPLVLDGTSVGVPLLDATDALACRAVEYAKTAAIDVNVEQGLIRRR